MNDTQCNYAIAPEIYEEAAVLIKMGSLVDAVRIIKTHASCTLLEAKQIVEQIRDKIKGFK